MGDVLGLPFMQRALLAGLLVGAITSVLGVFVVLRRSAFFGDALAHASLAGVAVGVVTGAPPLPIAAALAVVIGVSLHHVERVSRLSLDAILGFILPFFMAVGVLVISLSPGFQPELLSYLFGSILAVSWTGLAAVAVVSAAVAAMLIAVGRKLVFVTFDADNARIAGIPVARLLSVYHVLLALMIVASLPILGIVLVNALLVIPAATAKLLARSLRQMFVLAPAVGIGSVVLGLFGSFWLDVPSGPAIVVVAGLVFVASWAARARSRSVRASVD